MIIKLSIQKLFEQRKTFLKIENKILSYYISHSGLEHFFAPMVLLYIVVRLKLTIKMTTRGTYDNT